MAALDINECKLVTQFRTRVADVLQTEEQNEDMFLIRWLRARDLDVNKAEDMLRSSLNWREENNIDKISDLKFDSFYTTEYFFSLNGKDKLGHPVMFVPVGKWDFRKVVNTGKTDEFKLYVNQIFEQLMHTISFTNKNPSSSNITQFTAVLDWADYSYMQLVNIKAVQNLLHIGAIYEAHYPEILHRCFFINCPAFFGILMAMVKHVLAPKTISKISIYGHDRSTWEPAIHQEIDAAQLTNLFNSISSNSGLNKQ